MKKALLYVTVATAATFGFALLFFAVTGMIPALSARINYETLGSVLGYIWLFGVFPAAVVLGFEQQLKDEERQRDLPVHERENLRPLHLEGLPATLRAIAACRR